MPAAPSLFITQRLPDGVQNTEPCSLARARAIFDEHLANLAKPVAVLFLGRRLARKPLFLVLVEDVVQAFSEILNLSLNSPAPSVRDLLYGRAPLAAPDLRPPVLVSSSLKSDVWQWAAQRGIELHESGTVNAALLAAHEPHKHIEAFKALDVRAGEQAVHYVCQQDVVAVNKLAFLQLGQWKGTANEERVVNGYLEFVNQYLLGPQDGPFVLTA